jgi:hypothetical protein
MCTYSSVPRILLVVQLMFPISSVPAQTASSDVEMATGDAWSSRKELIYVPQEALELPTAIATQGAIIPAGDAWPSPKKDIPQEALASDIVGDQASERPNR